MSKKTQRKIRLYFEIMILKVSRFHLVLNLNNKQLRFTGIIQNLLKLQNFDKHINMKIEVFKNKIGLEIS